MSGKDGSIEWAKKKKRMTSLSTQVLVLVRCWWNFSLAKLLSATTKRHVEAEEIIRALTNLQKLDLKGVLKVSTNALHNNQSTSFLHFASSFPYCLSRLPLTLISEFFFRLKLRRTNEREDEWIP